MANGLCNEGKLYLFLMRQRPPSSTRPYKLFPYTTLFRSVHADHRREQTHRHEQDDRQWQHEAFILCGQYQEDEQHRAREDDPSGVRGRLLLEGDARQFGSVTSCKRLARELFHSRQRRARRRYRRGGAVYLARGEEVIARDERKRAGWGKGGAVRVG